MKDLYVNFQKTTKRWGDIMLFCSQCGEENSNDAKFCTSCGNRINDHSESLEDKPVVTNHGKSGNLYVILGWVSNAIAFLLFPIFGVGGIVFGSLHIKMNKKHGIIMLVVGIILLLTDFWLGFIEGFIRGYNDQL